MKISNHRIEVNNIFYDYALGAMWISISMPPRAAQWGDVPKWAQVEKTIPTPPELAGIIRASNPEVMRVVEARIRETVRSQHAGVSA